MRKNAGQIIIFSFIFGLISFYIFHRVAIIYATLGGDFLTKANQSLSLLGQSLSDRPILFEFSKTSLQAGGIAFACCLLFGVYVAAGQKNTRPGEEYGSARWGSPKDSAPFKDKEKDNNIILTQTESLSMSERMKNPEYDRNKNVVVIGGAGTRKTRGYVKPNLAQLHSSYVVTESKSLLPHETGMLFQMAGSPVTFLKKLKFRFNLYWKKKRFEKEGYRFKVFDLVNRENTDFFNPFAYIKKEDHILMVVDNFLKNSDGKIQKTGDPFWEKAEKALYSAIFSYLKTVGSTEEQTFEMVGHLVREGRVDGDDDQLLSPLDILFKDFEEEYPDHFAVKQFKTFKLASFKTARSILICAGVRLSPFDIPAIAKLTSKDTLELDTLGDEKTVLFICLPDTFESFNFIAAILYQVLFEVLTNKADNVYKGRLPVPVRCILDEFANIGQIPNFDKVISVIRSRGISVDIIIQALAQLKNLYKDTWETIMGSCDSLLYLGGMERSTHKYISELCEKETIDSRDTSQSYGVQGSYSKQDKKLGRDLITPGEVATMKNSECILKIRGLPPFKSKKYDLSKHKRYKYFSDANKKNWYDYTIGLSPVEEFLKNVKTVESFDYSELKNLAS